MDQINLRRRDRATQLVIDSLDGSVFGKNITVLGVTFKPHSDDIRDSPALDLAVRLHGLGANVTVTDPQGLDNARRAQPQLLFEPSRDEALRGADAVVLVTEWDEYRRQMDPVSVGALVRQRNIVDGRNALDPRAWRDAGWNYWGMGRP